MERVVSWRYRRPPRPRPVRWVVLVPLGWVDALDRQATRDGLTRAEVVRRLVMDLLADPRRLSPIQGRRRLRRVDPPTLYPLTVYFDPDLAHRIAKAAEAYATTTSAVVRRAVEVGLGGEGVSM